jgi:hypothetical protein
MRNKKMNYFFPLLHDGMSFVLIIVFLLQVLVCIVTGLYINAPVITESNKILQYLNPLVLGGYMIVITGLIMGLVINEKVPRKVVGIKLTLYIGFYNRDGKPLTPVPSLAETEI